MPEGDGVGGRGEFGGEGFQEAVGVGMDRTLLPHGASSIYLDRLTHTLDPL
jgi:hypothetical protein